MSYEHEDQDPEQAEQTPEEFLREKKRSLRHSSYIWIALGAVIVLANIVMTGAGGFSMSTLFRSLLFTAGLVMILSGLWGLFQAGRLTLLDYSPTPEAVQFALEGQGTIPYFSYLVIASLIAVTLCQFSTGLNQSFGIAGLVKPLVREQDQLWRLVTAGFMHAGFIHILFNCQALFGFGRTVEYFSHRSHLAIVFLFSLVCGNILSLFLMPQATSIGASGGILGLVGYLSIYGYRRKSQLPPGFLRNMLVNIGFIVAFGFIAYQIVDNASNLGGILFGALYGFVQVPKDLREDPRKVDKLTEIFGYACMAMILGFAIFTVLLLTKKITL